MLPRVVEVVVVPLPMLVVVVVVVGPLVNTAVTTATLSLIINPSVGTTKGAAKCLKY